MKVKKKTTNATTSRLSHRVEHRIQNTDTRDKATGMEKKERKAKDCKKAAVKQHSHAHMCISFKCYLIAITQIKVNG